MFVKCSLFFWQSLDPSITLSRCPSVSISLLFSLSLSFYSFSLSLCLYLSISLNFNLRLSVYLYYLVSLFPILLYSIYIFLPLFNTIYQYFDIHIFCFLCIILETISIYFSQYISICLHIYTFLYHVSFNTLEHLYAYISMSIYTL